MRTGALTHQAKSTRAGSKDSMTLLASASAMASARAAGTSSSREWNRRRYDAAATNT